MSAHAGARLALGVSVLAIVAGCATTSAPAPSAPVAAGAERPAAHSAETATPAPPAQPALRTSIEPPEGVLAVLRLRGRGNQIFRCEARAGAFAWVFRLPEAELADDQGRVIVHHGANYTFEHVDGSRVVGTIVGYERAAARNAITSVLLSARAFGKGALGEVSWIQRIDTQGGMPPPACDALQEGKVLRVPFSATFVFYR